MGVLVGGQKVYVEKVYVFFPSLYENFPYRYRYRSVIFFQLFSLPIPIRTPLPPGIPQKLLICNSSKFSRENLPMSISI